MKKRKHFLAAVYAALERLLLKGFVEAVMSDVTDAGGALLTFTWKLKYDETPMAFVTEDLAVMKTLFDAHMWCASPMPSAFSRFANNTTSGTAPLKVHHTLAWIVFLVRARAKYFIFDCFFHIVVVLVASTSASCTWRALNGQHCAVDPLAAQLGPAPRANRCCSVHRQVRAHVWVSQQSFKLPHHL